MMTSRHVALLACFISCMLLFTVVSADVVFDGFDDTSGLQLNGIATTVSTSDGTVLRVTPAQGNRAGSAFSLNRVNTEQFTSIFSFRITNSGGRVFDFNDEPGADGLVFVVQNVANNVGGVGGGIGYARINTSVGVEFDTWGNGFNHDPSQSHIGIDINGSVDHNNSGMGPTAIIGDTNVPMTDLPGPELDDGDRWWSWVRYNGADLDVFLTRSESATEPSIPASPLLSFPIDLKTTLGGSDQAFIGFTSATGADWSDHDVLYWRHTEAVVPEPVTFVLGIMAGLLVALRRRPAHR